MSACSAAATTAWSRSTMRLTGTPPDIHRRSTAARRPPIISRPSPGTSTPSGSLPVARSHVELMMAGFEIMLEGALCGEDRDPRLALPRLVRRHRDDARDLAAGARHAGAPPSVRPRRHASPNSRPSMRRRDPAGKPRGALRRGRHVPRQRGRQGRWRCGARPSASPPARSGPATSPILMDVTVFGETGLFAATRGADGKYVGIKPGTPQPGARPGAGADPYRGRPHPRRHAGIARSDGAARIRSRARSTPTAIRATAATLMVLSIPAIRAGSPRAPARS